MEMIIGGVYQGKENYARKNFPDITWKKGSELTEEELYQAEGILGFHDYIKRFLKEGKDLSGLAQELLEKNPKKLVTGSSRLMLLNGGTERLWDASVQNWQLEAAR